jgi:HD-like signal output (HDOD) protein
MAEQIAEEEDTWARQAFGFVQLLAGELSEGRVSLPGVPEVALRVQRVLNDEMAALDQIVQAVSAEPTLAMQVMRLANSVAYGGGLERAQDVRAAVQRIGMDMVRASALSFLVTQLRSSQSLRPLRDQLNALWNRAVAVGATGRALTTKVPGVTPDAALLVGLLHVVGNMYIVTRMHRVPGLDGRPEMVARISARWSGNIGKALLENWELPDDYGDAIAQSDNPDRASKGGANLTDVLAAAKLLAELIPRPTEEQPDPTRLAATYARHADTWRRLRLSEDDCRDALHSARRELHHLRSLFGA